GPRRCRRHGQIRTESRPTPGTCTSIHWIPSGEPGEGKERPCAFPFPNPSWICVSCFHVDQLGLQRGQLYLRNLPPSQTTISNSLLTMDFANRKRRQQPLTPCKVSSIDRR
ncbi:hypothetical protein JMJ77_0005860, partial [Colletotrichum scovillei]